MAALNAPEAEVADVVILGGGGSGLAAAVAAAKRGVRTVVLEKNPELGGTAALAIGAITGACTALQRRAGIRDCTDEFRQDMDAFTGDLLPRDNPVLRSMLAAEAGVTIDWLEELGVPFAGPYPEPPHRVSRMHNIIPGPRMLIAKLAAAATRAGLITWLDASMQRLLVGADGAVTGVEYSHGGVQRALNARRGVILATGDFSGNLEMRKANLSPAACAATPLNPGNTGDGHRLAASIGAVYRNMDVIFGPQIRFPRPQTVGITSQLPTWTWLGRLSAQYMMHAPAWMLKPLVTSLLIANMAPSETLFAQGALLMDIDGNTLDTQKPAVAVANARQAKAYIILDARIARLFQRFPYFISTAPGIAFAYFEDYRLGRPDLVHAAPTLDALAGTTGLPAERLRALGQTLKGERFYALGPVEAVLTTTEGSLDVDAQCRVLRADRHPIDGLYAVGCVGQGGMMLRGHGLHYAWMLTSGRVAGEAAARRQPISRGTAASASSAA